MKYAALLFALLTFNVSAHPIVEARFKDVSKIDVILTDLDGDGLCHYGTNLAFMVIFPHDGEPEYHDVGCWTLLESYGEEAVETQWVIVNAGRPVLLRPSAFEENKVTK